MSRPATPAERRRRGGTCPGCGRPAVPEHAPFCSKGCRDRDLLQWLDGGYRIPGPPVDPDDIDDAHG